MTDEEITRYLAEEVMGWIAMDYAPDDDRWVWCMSSGDPVMSCKAWSPMTRWDHAGMVVEKMPHFMLRRIGTRWECQSRFCGNWGDHIIEMPGYKCGCTVADAPAAPRAISLAAVEAHRRGADVG